MRRALLAAVLASGPPSAWASHEDLGLGARAAALGEALTAVGDDLSALGANPAGLSGLQNASFEAGFRRGFQIPAGALDFDRYSWSAGLPVEALPHKGALAVHGSHTGVKDVSLDRVVGITYATRGWKETGPGVLDIGVTLKSLGRSGRRLAGGVTKAGVDIGAIYRLSQDRSFGFSVLNVNGPRTDIGGAADRAPVAVKAGFAQTARGFVLALDLTKREPSAGRRATHSLGAGMERWLPTRRLGSVALRTGLNLGDLSKSWGLGFGWRVLGAEVDYSAVIPLASGSRWGNAVSLVLRFGSWNPEKEYENILGSEIRYRQDVTKALEAADVRQWKLGEDLRRLKAEIEDLRSELASKTADEAAAKDSAKAAQERLRAFQERQRAAERTLEQLAKEREAARLRTKESLFQQDWAAYQKLKIEGAPDLVLLERVKLILREYKDTGLDLSEANQELLRLLRSR